MNTKVVVINGKKTNFDGSIDWNVLSDEVVVYDYSNDEEIIERIQGAGIVVCKENPLPKAMIDRFPDSVHLLCEAGTGYNNIDVVACRERGITVTNIPSYSPECVAQVAMMHILNLASSMRKQMNMLAAHDHRNFAEHLMVSHVELQNKTLGIIGHGTIGKQVVKLANAFGMKVIAYTRTPGENTDEVTYVSLEEVLTKSDFVSLHCPLTPVTHHIIGEKELAMMKPTAYLVNTARGPLIDEKALIEALKNNVIAGAALDVQEVEPLAADSPLIDMENVILTPHIGWQGKETRQRLVDMLADNIHSYIAGNPINVKN
ncbi:MAG: D-2-hydroxyacid dehydrogenase [Erysipelotrichales bacterium]|nr:D-2-hydroxyacid dehydrogenase [Erysipelotrichales bacterium]